MVMIAIFSLSFSPLPRSVHRCKSVCIAFRWKSHARARTRDMEARAQNETNVTQPSFLDSHKSCNRCSEIILMPPPPSSPPFKRWNRRGGYDLDKKGRCLPCACASVPLARSHMILCDFGSAISLVFPLLAERGWLTVSMPWLKGK